MPLVSIITPTQAHNADHIDAVWRSIAEQPLPAGWELEWVVQEDGTAPAVGDRLPADRRIRYDALGVQVGSPSTRNHALARARGEVIAGMDHDDWYEPGGLTALLQALVDAPDVAWSCGRCVWVMEDSSTWMKDDVLPAGRVAAGAVTDHFLAHDDFPFPAAVTAFRRAHLLAHGGWPAVARSTDAILVAAFSDRWDGWWIDSTVAAYRRWPAQKTVQPQDWQIRDLPHVRGIVAQRREAEAALRRCVAVPPPGPDGPRGA
ncbi:glycosyltransferase family 2 protein [soil metagenome]